MSTAGLHRYTVEHRIGNDSSGELFLASHRSPDRSEKQVLISCVAAPTTGPDSPPAQLMREHITSSALHHSAIVQVLDAGRNDDVYFLVFEYLNGPDLEDLLARSAARGMMVPVDVVLHIARQAAAALRYTHIQPYPPRGAVAYHGSLCPTKVHLSIIGTVKLRGFGAGPAPLSYRCPEQLRAPAGSKAGDLFSLGTLVFEALCGESPFDGSTEHEIREALASCRPPPVRSLRPEVPEGLEHLIHKCLQAEPAKRYAQADDLLQDISRLMHYRRVSNGAGLLSDFIAEAFPERSPGSAPQPVARGATPYWEELCHRLSPRLVELPRSMEEGRSTQVRLIRPSDMAEDVVKPGLNSSDSELPHG